MTHVANFTMKELCRSLVAEDKCIDNTPPPSVLKQLEFTIAGLERLRAFLGAPIRINSGYRSKALNDAVGGSPSSQHMFGEAVDFVCPGYGSPRAVAESLSRAMPLLGIDQLIFEHTWVHVSFTLWPRYEVLTRKSGGKYVVGIV